VAGWHIHALTADYLRGGHVLDVEATNLQVRTAELADVRMAIPDTEDFLEADLTQDLSEQLATAESDH
jgi:acetolactate decarboxylase